MNQTGKKERVLICCLTTEVVKVVKPIDFYEATRVHIIAYPNTNESDHTARFYNTFLKEARNRIEEGGRADVIVHYANILDYQEMLRTIVRTAAEEKAKFGSFVDIYVNISSGTPEYIAGAMLASMQDESLIAFSVRTKTRSMNLEQAMEAYTVDGKPVGRTSEVYDPAMIMTFGAEAPDDRLVACLGILKGMNENKRYPSFNDVIVALKNENEWDYVPESKKTRTDDAQKERMYFRRNYIDPMLSKGWIVEDHIKRNRYILTRKGEAVVSVYSKEGSVVLE